MLHYKNFFIELGGEIAAQGRHPQGRLWRAGIERPLAGKIGVEHIVSIQKEALATSGDAINGYSYGRRRYSHIIDPNTHLPVDTALASVSVFSPSAMTADALATALYAMGAEQGIAFAEGEKIPAFFIIRDADKLRSHATYDFSTRIIR